MRKLAARLFLWLTGWEPEGAMPTAPKYVLIAAPHTSNWDLAYLLAIGAVLDVRVAWMGKHQIFRGPMGWIIRHVNFHKMPLVLQTNLYVVALKAKN